METRTRSSTRPPSRRARALGAHGALVITIALAACTDSTAPAASVAATGADQLRAEGSARHFLIADQFNNRVIETDERGTILWHFGGGPDDVGPTAIVGVNDAERVGDLTLMAGTGAPPGTEPRCPDGCPDNRVLLADRAGRIVWQYGTFGVTGAGPNELDAPVQSTYLPNGHVLITDQGNQRVIEVERAHNTIVWQYGTTGVPGDGRDQLDDPNSAELLPNGRVLIADEANDRAIEVTREKRVVATYSARGTVSGVAFASRLPDGHTLLTDAGHDRIVEVDASDQVVWQYRTDAQPGSNEAPQPTRAVRLADGTTLISDQFNHRVIVVNRAGQIVRSFGRLNHPGFSLTSTDAGLNAPYDAKVVGDFTGLTPPR